MDKKALISAIKVSISDVLSTMFFMPVDVVSAASSDNRVDESEIVSVSLDFTGPAKGVFWLELPMALARDVTSDFLGMDSGRLSAEDVTGTIKEMINMLVGNALSVYAPEETFTLGIPTSALRKTDTQEPDENKRIHMDIRTLGSYMTILVDLES